MTHIGYIDESVHNQGRGTFTLSCVIATAATWNLLDANWKAMWDLRNEKLRLAGRKQIARYHAADSSSLQGDLAGWSTEEQRELTAEILGIFRKQEALSAFAFSVNLRELAEEWSWTATDPLEAAHRLVLEWLIRLVGRQLGAWSRTAKIALFHDRSRCNATLQQSFQRLMEDVTFTHQEYFSEMAPVSWQDCIPLQVADLVAYESSKDNERCGTDRNRRFTLQKLLEVQGFEGRSSGYDRSGV